MSGIVGIFNLDGAAVDRLLLSRMTDFLSYRGPDASGLWIDGNFGFGHTLLCTTEDALSGRQPSTLDGQVWIVADARVDSPRELRSDLCAEGRHGVEAATDAELILHAYHAWGERCVEHLLGDFSFAIFDSSRRQVFCARDQIGIKPFYYARVGHSLIFSNALDCIRFHPLVSDRLNESAIGDFLLFDFNLEPTTTTFADIERLAPGHCAVVSAADWIVRRYWSIPIEEPRYYQSQRDYTEQFHQLLNESVSDRLRTTRLGILMSGGIDSPTLAVTARDLLRERSSSYRLGAFTTVHEGLIPDSERHYASVVANHLAIQIDFRATSEDRFEYPSTTVLPEPVAYTLGIMGNRDHYDRISSYARVFFNGHGADDALIYEWGPHLSYLRRKHAWRRLGSDLLRDLIAHRRVPLVSRVFRTRRQSDPSAPSFPTWLNEDFSTRLRLRARWNEMQTDDAPSPHPVRPRAYSTLGSVAWQPVFESFDPAYTGVPVEFRYPFLDLRLLRFLLTVPALPWCRDKFLLRRAMRDVLPAEIIRRPKAGLTGDPTLARVRRSGLPSWTPTPQLSHYAQIERAVPMPNDSQTVFGAKLRILGLNYWLKNFRSVVK